MGQQIRKERKFGPAPVVSVRSASGGAAGEITLPAEIFAITPNVPVMHQVVTAQLAAARAGTQSTKTRAEVEGSGAKPWRQKGTGRARQGSTRAPHFIGGGVALGPKPRSYRQKTPKKMVQLALRSALSDRVSEDRLIVIDRFDWAEPKTSVAATFLREAGISGRVLIVLGEGDENAYLSFRNLSNVHVVPTSELNTFDVLKSDYIVFTRQTLPTVATDDDLEGQHVALAPTRKTSTPAAAVDGAETEGAGE